MIPILQIRNTNGEGWRVYVEFADGSSEEISGFKNENEANEWIANSLSEWLERREQDEVDA